jgi:hypothetical protein
MLDISCLLSFVLLVCSGKQWDSLSSPEIGESIFVIIWLEIYMIVLWSKTQKIRHVLYHQDLYAESYELDDADFRKQDAKSQRKG